MKIEKAIFYFYLLKDSFVAGPSIIFNRYHVANKTYIRNGNELCKKMIGYDANMPTGLYEHITKYNLMKRILHLIRVMN